MIRPLGTNLIVKRYERPEKYPGGIILVPESWRKVGDTTIFEYVRASEKALEAMDAEPPVGSIITVADGTAVYLGHYPEDGGELWAVPAEAVKSVIWNTWEEGE